MLVLQLSSSQNLRQKLLYLSGIITGHHMVNSCVSMVFVDKVGRRKLMFIHILGLFTCLIILAGLFHHTAATEAKIRYHESAHLV